MRNILLSLYILFSFCSAAQNKTTIMLAGASFGIPDNGWFEIGCKIYNAYPVNKSVSGEAIYHTANKMSTGTFYTADELENTDILVIMHVHNQDVANETKLKEDYLQYSMPTTNYSVAYDYVIKKYKEDCYNLRDNPTSKYYGTTNGKPSKIILCTHWHDARTIYNNAIRKLADKWNLPLIEWDKKIGFTKDSLINGVQPSLQYAMDTEVINDITYAWHPLRGATQYIQKKFAEIFVDKLEELYGIIPVSATVNAKSRAILQGEDAYVSFSFTGQPPWNLVYQVNGQTFQINNIFDNPLIVNVPLSINKTAIIRPTFVENKSSQGSVSGETTVYCANKYLNPTFDTYVNQENILTSYATEQSVQIKTTPDPNAREAFFSFNLDKLNYNDEKIIFRTFFYRRLYPYYKNVLEDHLIEISGNTNSYNTLNWNNKPINLDVIENVKVTSNELESFITWDITNWVKQQMLNNASTMTLNLKVKNSSGTGLLYFYSSEYGGEKRPEILAVNNNVTHQENEVNNELNVRSDLNYNNIYIHNDIPINNITVFSIVGNCIYKKHNISSTDHTIVSSMFKTGIYLIEIESGEKREVVKFLMKHK